MGSEAAEDGPGRVVQHGGEREGERGKMSAGGEGEVVCVARRWAFKTRAVSGARLSLPPPTQPTLPCLSGLALLALAPALGDAGLSTASNPCGLRRSQFSTWRKKEAWACCSVAARLLCVGHLHLHFHPWRGMKTARPSLASHLLHLHPFPRVVESIFD